MRVLILLSGILLGAGPAMAHIGHIGELAGHGHWLAAGALAAAAGLAALGAMRGRKEKAEAESAGENPEAEPETEPQEA